MDNTRRYYYGKIHEHARSLELPDPNYRNVLYALTGKRSCTELSETELFRVNMFLSMEVARREVRSCTHVSDAEALEILGMTA